MNLIYLEDGDELRVALTASENLDDVLDYYGREGYLTLHHLGSATRYAVSVAQATIGIGDTTYELERLEGDTAHLYPLASAGDNPRDPAKYRLEASAELATVLERENLLRWSEKYTVAPWERGGNLTVVSTGNPGPNGRANATRLKAALLGSVYTRQSVTVQAGVGYTFRAWLRVVTDAGLSSGNAAVLVHWQDAAGAIVGTNTLWFVTDVPVSAAWQEAVLSAAAPTGAVTVRLFTLLDPPANTEWEQTEMQVNTDAALPYTPTYDNPIPPARYGELVLTGEGENRVAPSGFDGGTAGWTLGNAANYTEQSVIQDVDMGPVLKAVGDPAAAADWTGLKHNQTYYPKGPFVTLSLWIKSDADYAVIDNGNTALLYHYHVYTAELGWSGDIAPANAVRPYFGLASGASPWTRRVRTLELLTTHSGYTVLAHRLVPVGPRSFRGTMYRTRLQITESNAALVDTTTTDTPIPHASGLVEWSVAFAGAEVALRYRERDENDYWVLALTATGALELREVLNGVATVRGTLAGAAVSGNSYRLTVKLEGKTHTVHLDDALAFTYADPNAFHVAEATVRGVDGGTRLATYPPTVTLGPDELKGPVNQSVITATRDGLSLPLGAYAVEALLLDLAGNRRIIGAAQAQEPGDPVSVLEFELRARRVRRWSTPRLVDRSTHYRLADRSTRYRMKEAS